MSALTSFGVGTARVEEVWLAAAAILKLVNLNRKKVFFSQKNYKKRIGFKETT
jgi:hypothetical protein